MTNKPCTPPSGAPPRQGLEARLTHGPVQRDERRHRVARTECGGDAHLRIHGRRGAADIGLQMAAAAAIEVEARPETIGHAFGFFKVCPPGIEERVLVGRETGNALAGAICAGPHARIALRICPRRTDEKRETEELRDPSGVHGMSSLVELVVEAAASTFVGSMRGSLRAARLVPREQHAP